MRKKRERKKERKKEGMKDRMKERKKDVLFHDIQVLKRTKEEGRKENKPSFETTDASLNFILSEFVKHSKTRRGKESVNNNTPSLKLQSLH